MTTRILFTLLILSLFSCSEENYKIYLRTNSVFGVAEKSSLTCNGFKIGSVNKMSLINPKEILVELKIIDKVKIPKNSNFKILNLDLSGNQGFAIEIGSGKQSIQPGDTIYVDMEEPSFFFGQIDSIGIEVGNIIDKLIKIENQDSILKELRKLNETLDE